MALTYTWNTITAGMVDSDSPLNQILMDDIRENLIHNYEWIGKDYTPADNHAHNGVDSALTAFTAAVNPLVVWPADFVAQYDTNDWEQGPGYLRNRTTVGLMASYAPVPLPDGVTVSQMVLYGYKTTASAVSVNLKRKTFADGTEVQMATVALSGNGYLNASTSSISYATIDNDAYNYTLELGINPDTAITNAAAYGVLIYWGF